VAFVFCTFAIKKNNRYMNLIVFDIDGTMTLSEQHHLGAFQDAMNGVGVMNIDDDWKSYKHITDTHIFKHNYIAQFGHEPDEDTLALLEELLLDSIQEFVSPLEMPGAKQIVNTVKAHPNYAFAYATGSLYTPAQYKLDETGIHYHQDILIGANGFDSREEIVNAAIEAAKKYHRVDHFDKIISAGDGLWDLQTAKNLELLFLGIGAKNMDAFTDLGAKYCEENWLEIDMEYLDGVL